MNKSMSILGFIVVLVMAMAASGFAVLASADIASKSDGKSSSAIICVSDIHSTTELSLSAVNTEAITIISAPNWLPRNMGFSYYSPGLEIGYSGLKNKKYTLKIWLLERTNWYCASTPICEKTITIDNTAGNNSSGTIRITEVFDVYNYPTFDWVVRLYDGTTQVDWTERYATGTYNRPPQLSLIGDKEAIRNELLEFTINGTDPNGDGLTYQADNLPSGASVDSENRTFSWIPTTVGQYSNIRFKVTDNGEGNLYDSEYITIIVRSPEQPPEQIKGVCYGPFRDGQNPDWGPYPSEADIREDMSILKYMTKAIRTYGVCKGLEEIVPIANEFDLKVSPGAWICSNYEGNEEEINNLTSLAQNYEVETVIVGSEVVLRYEKGWDTLTKSELIDYITRVKENVSVPVTTGEPWHIWDTHPDLVNAVDYILLHVHPYWEGVPVNNAADYVVERYEQIQNKYPQKEVVIGEIGWPSEGLPNGEAVPSLENQKHFMEEFLKLANEKGISFYYFEAFDEKWKAEPNGVGPHWGFYYLNRTAKHSIDSVLPHVFYFDTGNGCYPSIMGIHTGNITPNHDIIVTKMYTHPCSGTGGHSEYVKFWNESWIITANWTGYKGDWHNISFGNSFTLEARETYNYTIHTGSYPQIHHVDNLSTPAGFITCSEFIDANRKRYVDWIPAIRLE